MRKFWLLPTVSVRVSVAVIKRHCQKQLGEEKMYYKLAFYIIAFEGSQGRTLQAGADRGQGGVLLTDLLL